MPEIRSRGAEQIRRDLSKETLDAAGDALLEELRASSSQFQGAGTGIGTEAGGLDQKCFLLPLPHQVGSVPKKIIEGGCCQGLL